MGSIEGRHDLWAGRSKEDLISAESQKRNRCFTSLSYSADGSVILAGGRFVSFLVTLGYFIFFKLCCINKLRGENYIRI